MKKATKQGLDPERRPNHPKFEEGLIDTDLFGRKSDGTRIYEAELKMEDVLDGIERLECKLNKLEATVDLIQLKASISDCLLVIRKTEEEFNSKPNTGG